MAERSEKKSKEERGMEFEKNTYFAHNAFILFYKAEIVAKCFEADLETWEKVKVKQILDQMLHSILFLGRIHSK
ncbi:hypothetical protein AMELA_G00176350 [Ameiurus melas]|uniref:Uncharacterized protein n=1 Tax=Ameiurus melas TaxID=219545 RepID=A0A7J6ADF7_AMEME|nr:hypothetical protein AMELA_G00176350 [Ameiurus melas]